MRTAEMTAEESTLLQIKNICTVALSYGNGPYQHKSAIKDIIEEINELRTK